MELRRYESDCESKTPGALLEVCHGPTQLELPKTMQGPYLALSFCSQSDDPIERLGSPTIRRPSPALHSEWTMLIPIFVTVNREGSLTASARAFEAAPPQSYAVVLAT
jgi:hypothetical protein